MNNYLIILLLIFTVFLIFWFILFGKKSKKQSNANSYKKLHIQIDREIYTVDDTVTHNSFSEKENTHINDTDINIRSLETATVIGLNSIPNGYNVDKNKLPFKENRVYGWGKEFNTFVTPTGKYFHKSKCPKIKGKNKILIHRYNAIKKYSPCPYCKPKAYIDNWYMQNFPHENFSNTQYIGEQLKLFDK